MVIDAKLLFELKKSVELKNIDKYYAVLALITEESFNKIKKLMESFGLSMKKLSHLKIVLMDENILLERLEYARENKMLNKDTINDPTFLLNKKLFKSKTIDFVSSNNSVIDEMASINLDDEVNNMINDTKSSEATSVLISDKIKEVLSIPQSNTFSDITFARYEELSKHLTVILNTDSEIKDNLNTMYSNIAKLITIPELDLSDEEIMYYAITNDLEFSDEKLIAIKNLIGEVVTPLEKEKVA